MPLPGVWLYSYRGGNSRAIDNPTFSLGNLHSQPPPLDLHGPGLVVRLEGSFDESRQRQTTHAKYPERQRKTIAIGVIRIKS
jgi:hypothetical protein